MSGEYSILKQFSFDVKLPFERAEILEDNILHSEIDVSYDGDRGKCLAIIGGLISVYSGKEKFVMAEIGKIDDSFITNFLPIHISEKESWNTVLTNINDNEYIIQCKDAPSYIHLFQYIKETLGEKIESLFRYAITFEDIEKYTYKNFFGVIFKIEKNKLTVIYKEKYDKILMEEIVENFRYLVQNFNKMDKVSKGCILAPSNRDLALKNLSGKKTVWDYKPIINIFEENANKYGNKTAVNHKGENFTYKALSDASEELANTLSRYGVIAGDVIAITTEKSINYIIAILAVLKCKAAFLPISDGIPSNRKMYMLENSNAKFAIKNNCVDDIKQFEIESLESWREDKKQIVSMDSKESIIYVLYTSGTSGRPKGTVVNQYNLYNVIMWYINNYDVTYVDKIAQLTDISFDPSIEQIFVALLTGATIYILDKIDMLDITYVRKWISENSITIINEIPVMLEQILVETDKFDSLRVVISGGSRLTPKICKEILTKGYNLFNHYGLTETAIDNITYKCNLKKMCIGKAIDNIECLVLDDEGCIVPRGVVGNLYIGGLVLPVGYINNSELTNERFKYLPMYGTTPFFNTGDKVYYDIDYCINYIGREDSQVKINGYRIEMNEIECVARSYSKVNNVVVFSDNINEKTVVRLFFTASVSVLIDDLKRYLSSNLPVYMIPCDIIQLDKFPLLPSGKIDMRKLRSIREKSSRIIEKPRNEIEHKILKLWEKVLNIDINEIDIKDNFFDIGGDSISAISILFELQEDYSELTITDIFNYVTVKELAFYITSKIKK